ncbi:hypothetical protein [Streptomyces sp. NPDC088752]|uniref:hypothetical protein n=1 Tax=Streptomyces sp. NPDC088752 TaxID=3154963 RepID=UPI00341470CB
MNIIPAPVALRTPEFRGITREDVAAAVVVAVESMSEEDRALVAGHAPSVALSVAFLRAQSAWTSSRTPSTEEERAAYNRTADLASAAMIFEKEDDPRAAAAAMAEYSRIVDRERAAESARREEASARVLAAQWEGAESFGKGGYLVRTEERGHGIVAVYVKGPASETDKIDRAAVAYARARLAFAPGLSAGAVSSGGEFTGGGRTYIAQHVFTTERLAPRED